MIEPDLQVTTAIGDYTSAWDDYRRRRRRLFDIFVGGFAVIALWSFLFRNNAIQALAPLILCPIWMLTVIVLSIPLSRFKCPRCGRPFFQTWLYHNAFARKCVHCGLRMWAKNDSTEEKT
jgi:hypothetical protein